MKKIYGIFVCNNLENVFNLDKDLYEMMNNKFNCFYIVDLSLIYGFAKEVCLEKFTIFRPKNFSELNRFLTGNLNIFFNHVPRNFKFIKFHIFINKKNLINMELNRGNSIQLEEQFYEKRNYKFSFEKKFIRALYKVLSLFNVVKNYDYLFISTKGVNKYYHNNRDKFLNKIFSTKKFFKHKKIILINDKSFDLSAGKKKSEEFILYIDSPIMKIKDSNIPLSAYPNKLDRNNFYKSLSKTLLFLSKKYKKKILVNLHPKSDYLEVKKYFKQFTLKKFDLWNSIDRSFLVTGLASTSYSYVIFNKKKRLVFFSRKMGRFHTHRANILCKNYKILLLNIDNRTLINENDLKNPNSLDILRKKIKLDDKFKGTTKICKIIENFK